MAREGCVTADTWVSCPSQESGPQGCVASACQVSQTQQLPGDPVIFSWGVPYLPISAAKAGHPFEPHRQAGAEIASLSLRRWLRN